MKSARLVGPEQIEVVDVPDPVCPDDGIILEMRACGVCGSDLRRWRAGPPEGTDYLVQGHELSGMVVEIGSSVKGYEPGERLAVAPDIHCGTCYSCRRGRTNLCDNLRLLGITPGLSGGFAEKVVLPEEVINRGRIHRMPEGMTFEEGGLAETLSSVLASMDKVQVGLGETVVIIGAGPIGCLMITAAKARGAKPVLIERVPHRLDYASTFEPIATLNSAEVDPVAEVRRITGGIGADVVFCANPVVDTQRQAVEMVRKGGRVVLFGGVPKDNPMTHLDSNLIHYGEIEVVGAFSYLPHYHEEAVHLLAGKIFRAELMVTQILPLSRVAEAFATAATGQGLKVMVVPDAS